MDEESPTPGMNSGVAVDLTGGAATGGETSTKMGDWTGSEINMGGGGVSTAELIVVAASILTFGIVGLIVWAVSRKK